MSMGVRPLERKSKAKLVLTSRSGLPPREEWNAWVENHEAADNASRQIRQIQDIEALGAEVLVLPADVADEAQMRVVIQQAIATFGTIHGVLHAAGVPASGLMQLKTPEMAASVLAPKVVGTLVLERVLQDIPLDFLVLFSSMSSITGGGPGQVDFRFRNGDCLEVRGGRRQRGVRVHGVARAADRVDGGRGTDGI